MPLTIYELKPRFQGMLRPLVGRLESAGIRANHVTIFAAAVSIGLGTTLCLAEGAGRLFLLLPLWMFLRMALNAVDGMLAREFGQKSALGAYLNELTDVVSDAALYLPFAWVPGSSWLPVALLVAASIVSEMAGALGPMVGVERRYDGPMGKSDRAFLFGLLGLLVGLGVSLQCCLVPALWFTIALIIYNTVRRVRRGVAEAARKGSR
ncbi:MAG: CDP-alcohol phosphatidyltransferase family protein [Fibrobacteria bacterium]|nr:CDP-alcohol phosphatidyltransferase family protein [Fibrobacteria bacterium]